MVKKIPIKKFGRDLYPVENGEGKLIAFDHICEDLFSLNIRQVFYGNQGTTLTLDTLIEMRDVLNVLIRENLHELDKKKKTGVKKTGQPARAGEPGIFGQGGKS